MIGSVCYFFEAVLAQRDTHTTDTQFVQYVYLALSVIWQDGRRVVPRTAGVARADSVFDGRYLNVFHFSYPTIS